MSIDFSSMDPVLGAIKRTPRLNYLQKESSLSRLEEQLNVTRGGHRIQISDCQPSTEETNRLRFRLKQWHGQRELARFDKNDARLEESERQLEKIVNLARQEGLTPHQITAVLREPEFSSSWVDVEKATPSAEQGRLPTAQAAIQISTEFAKRTAAKAFISLGKAFQNLGKSLR